MKAIVVSNISKKYSVSSSQERDVSFREMLTIQLYSFFKKRDSYHDFYALKDINFEVEQGEVIGIVGKNGSGKSTLLKILSKITAPTSGKAIIRGRVASLLEVGTGFHGELSGRENIFMSGIILGMKRWEINKYFREIVTFAGVEKFLDVPVKKYSSGMRLRLAFSVAAHLQPEILLVDEVLAVGDYEFEKKCLKVIKNISSTGRTILFVSHNMDTIERLCTRVLLMKEGEIIADGSPKDIVSQHLGVKQNHLGYKDLLVGGQLSHEIIDINEIHIVNKSFLSDGTVYSDQELMIEFSYNINQSATRTSLSLNFYNIDGQLLFSTFEALSKNIKGGVRNIGRYKSVCSVPKNIFNEGVVYVSLKILNSGVEGKIIDSNTIAYHDKILSFYVKNDRYKNINGFIWKNNGLISPEALWSVNKNIS